MNQVIISKFKDGSLVKETSTDDIVIIRISQDSMVQNGFFLQEVKKGMNIPLRRETYDKLEAQGKMVEGTPYSDIVGFEPKLVIIESYERPHDNAEPKINPETGNEITSNGKAVYREVMFATEDCPEDFFLPTDKVVEKESAGEFAKSKAGKSLDD